MIDCCSRRSYKEHVAFFEGFFLDSLSGAKGWIRSGYLCNIEEGMNELQFIELIIIESGPLRRVYQDV